MEGIVRIRETKATLISPNETIIECAAPLLRSMMVSQLTGPDINIGLRPVPPVRAKWLIARTIEVCIGDAQVVIIVLPILTCLLHRNLLFNIIFSPKRLSMPMASRPSTHSRWRLLPFLSSCFPRLIQPWVIMLSQRPKNMMNMAVLRCNLLRLTRLGISLFC